MKQAGAHVPIRYGIEWFCRTQNHADDQAQNAKVRAAPGVTVSAQGILAMNCAIYLRVSTERQTNDNQRAEVEQLVRARGYDPVWYEEVESAVKRRPVLDRLLADAHRGKVQAVAVWALDRLARSMTGAIDVVLRLDRSGVRVLSVREAWLDNEGPVRPLLVAIFGWVAEQERARLIERIHAGLARARSEGKHLGRPKTRPAPVEVRVLRERGLSWRQVARKLDTSVTSARRAVEACS